MSRHNNVQENNNSIITSVLSFFYAIFKSFYTCKMDANKFSLVLCFLVVITIDYSYAMDKDAILNSDDDRHENSPRFFGGIFSRPKPEAEKQHGPNLKEHIGNVLKGGSIGFQAEFRPLAPLHGLIDHAKKIIPIPGIHKPGLSFPMSGKEPIIPIPGIHKPGLSLIPMSGKEPKKPGPWWSEEEEKKVEPPSQDYEWKNPKDETKKEDLEDEGHYGWEKQDPEEKVETNGPRWEDIGEDAGDYYNDHTTVPIEEIIQPRIRTKRRAESKVYYLPLDFLTNGKPYKVRIGTNDDSI